MALMNEVRLRLEDPFPAMLTRPNGFGFILVGLGLVKGCVIAVVL
jgi:hypothetical protein